MDLADYSLTASPQDRQALMAEILRARQRGEGQSALEEANRRGSRFDMAAVASLMANNPALAEAAQLAMRNAQSADKPRQLGNQGFMIPSSGQFVPSPIYEDEQRERRDAARDAQRARLDQQTDAARMRRDQFEMGLNQRREMAEQGNALRMTLAQLMEQGRNERAGERNALAQTLAALRMGDRADAMSERNRQRAEKDQNDRMQRFTSDMTKEGVPEFESALGLVEATLNKYKPGNLPGFGRVQSAIPNVLASDEMQGVRADMQQAANILLKSRSGAAVTDSEMRRFLQEVAMGNFMDEATLRRGWQNVRKTFDAKKAAILSSVPPEVLQTYNERSGATYQQANQPQQRKRIKFDSQGNVVP